MIGIFKQKSPANILLLLFFGILLKLPMFLHPHVVTRTGDESALFKAILNFLEPRAASMPALYPVLAFLLMYFQAVMLTRFINNQRMMSPPTYLPGMTYLLITSLFPEWNFFSAPLLVNTILIYVLTALLKIYNQQNVKGTIFNIGLAMGIASFLFFPSLSFMIWILLSLMVMRPFRINEWVLCLVGLATPFYFYALYLFISDNWSWQAFWPHFEIGLPSIGPSIWLAGSTFLMVVPFLAGGYYVQDNLRRMLIQVRKGWSLLLLYLLGSIFIPFINSQDSFENWVLAGIPFAAFHACTYLYSRRSIFPLLLFWLTVAFIIGYQYFGPGW